MHTSAHRQRLAACLSIALALTAASCAGVNTEASQPTVRVFKSTGSVQCSKGGISLATLASQLEDAGLKVYSAACGSDGRMYPAVCGAPDGRIAIFEILSDDAPKASRLGFAPLSNLPEANVMPCK